MGCARMPVQLTAACCVGRRSQLAVHAATHCSFTADVPACLPATVYFVCRQWGIWRPARWGCCRSRIRTTTASAVWRGRLMLRGRSMLRLVPWQHYTPFTPTTATALPPGRAAC